MKLQTAIYKSVGGLQIRADVHLPDGDGPHPTIVFVHGGALIRGGRAWIEPLQRDRYVEDGFAVVSIDYRLAPETKLPAIASDVDDAFVWLRGEGGERYQLDPDRLAVMGQSGGGYLALLAGQRVRPRPRAVVSLYGYGDIAGEWLSRPDPFYRQQPLISESDAYMAVGADPVSAVSESANEGRGRYYRYCRQQGMWQQAVVGRTPAHAPGMFARYCPVLNVTGDYPPTFLLHGDRDTDVPHEQSEMMAAALSEAGVEHEFVTIADGGHALDYEPDRPDVADALARIRDFLGRHL